MYSAVLMSASLHEPTRIIALILIDFDANTEDRAMTP